MSERRQMTTAEARAAGLLDNAKPAKVRTTRKAEPRDGAESRCLTHGETFTTNAAEDRHVNAHHGCRIEFNYEVRTHQAKQLEDRMKEF